jgi:hypothetical protein
MTLSMQSKILMFLLIAALLFPAVIGILTIVPLNPLEVRSIKITNPNRIVVAGEQVHYAVDATKYTNKPCKILRQLINERTTHYTMIESNIPTGTKSRGSSLNTAEGDMPGTYYIRWTAIYNYFNFREVVITKDSETFEMIRGDMKGDKGDRGKQGIQGEKGDAGGIRLFK